MHITREHIDNANKLIDEQIKLRNLNSGNHDVRMAAALELIWTILYDYDGYENNIDGLKSIIDESYSLALATEYWKVYENGSSINAQ
jgi:hypothetical protein